MVRWNAVRLHSLAWALPLGVALSLVLGTGRAHAHPLVDEGRRLYEEEANFTGALDALGRAEAQDDLTREELVVLLETRAIVHVATGDQDAMRADVRRLVAIAPEHDLGPHAHPDLARAIAAERARGHGALRLVPRTESAEAGLTIVVDVENDWASVVREVRIAGRPSGASEWQHAVDAPLLIASAGAATIEYHAEAIGPGGVVLARTGTPDAPLRAAAPGSGGVEAWPFVLAGVGALLVGGAIVTAVLVTSNAPATTQVAPFTVRF